MLKRFQAIIYASRFALPIAMFLGVFLGIMSISHNPVLGDLDVGWLIRTGEYLLDHWRFPPGDIYSFSNPGKPWVLYQWGFEIYLGGLHRLANLGGVIWGTALILGITYAFFLYWLLRIGLSPGWAVGLAILTAMANTFHWYSRPQTMTILFYVMILYVLEGYRLRPGKQLLVLPVIFLLWANVHLGFIWGLAVVLLYGVWALSAPAVYRGPDTGRDPWPLLIFFFCLGAAMINPYGPALFSYLWELTFSYKMNSHIQELQSPDFHHFCLIFTMFQLVLLLWLSGPQYPGKFLFLSLLTITLCMGLYSVRHLTLFTIPATLHLAYSIKARLNLASPDRASIPRAGWLLAGLAVVLSLVWVVSIERWRPGFYQFPTKKVPKGAVLYLADQAHASQPLRIFNFRDSWGDYLIYALYPHIRVYLDTRFDMYGDNFFSETIKTYNKALRDFSTLIPWEVDFILLDKEILKNQYIEKLNPKGPFILVYEDEQALLYKYNSESDTKLP
jgi:hypothetical protein